MDEEGSLLNEAIPLFLGKGLCAFPKPDGLRLKVRFGAQLGFWLEHEITSILLELNSTAPNWKLHTLDEATKLAVQHLKNTYPNLTDEALSALGWNFSYNWK